MPENDMNQKLGLKSDDANDERTMHPSVLEELGRRLSALYDAIGNRSKAADIAFRSTDQLAKYAKGAVEPPFMPLARLCSAAGVRLEWLAFGIGPMYEKDYKPAPQSPSQSVRHEELSMAIQLVDEALEGKTLETAKRAELVALVYEGLVEGLPEATVLRWARTATK